MAYIMVGMAALSTVNSIMQTEEDARKQEEAIKSNRLAARADFYTTQSSVSLMKERNKVVTEEAIAEKLRAGGANAREIESQVEKAASSQVASNEGLTSGRSQGRALIETMIKGNELLLASNSETSTGIMKLMDQKDKVSNDLNLKIFEAHNNLTTILSQEGAEIDGTNDAISAGLSGASAGASIGSAMGAYTA